MKILKTISIIMLSLLFVHAAEAKKKKGAEKLDRYAFESGDTVTYYFNDNWVLVDQPNNATGTRKAWPVLKDRYAFIEQYDNGSVRVAGISYGPEPEAKLEEEYKQYSKDGVLLKDEYYKFGKKHGMCKSYYDTGELKSECTYEEGKPVGVYKTYYEGGQLKSESNYVEGKRDGVFRSYHESGAKKLIIHYVDGKKEGTYESYHENGQVEYVSTFTDNELYGETINYDEDGNVYRVSEKKDGEWIKDIYYHPDGSVRVEYPYEQGLRHGKVVETNEAGNTVHTVFYSAGEKDGEEYYYDSTGVTVLAKYNYVDGAFDGEQITNYTNGSIKSKKVYKEGELHQDLVYDTEGKEFYRLSSVISPAFIDFNLNKPDGFAAIADDHRGTGLLLMTATISADGEASGHSVIESANYYFDSIALAKFKTLHFKPGKYLGVPSAMDITVRVKITPAGWQWELGHPYNIEERKKAPHGAILQETMPVFTGGDQALYTYLGTSVMYPEAAREKGIQGVVYLNFTILESGFVSEVIVLRSVHWSLDRESLRVAREMPIWTPGQQRDTPVKVNYNLPIRFTLR